MHILSTLISKDLQQVLVKIESTSALNDGSMCWYSRNYDLIEAMLPVVLFMEAMGILVDPKDFLDINKLVDLVASLQKTHRFSASLACRKLIQVMLSMPDYHEKNGSEQSDICKDHYHYVAAISLLLCNAAKA